ncbi:MAG: restriction endonuclease subunit S [Candidatus Levybacteria bacterium]|nr:restriction endonuclease subunit S [Candidatus Levybacteria bacterium]
MKNNWPTKKLGECLVQFDRGISWSRKDEGGTIAVLRIPNIEEGRINLDDLKYISTKNGNGELDKNDIVMVASNGNPDLVGRSALVAEKEEGMRFASFLVRLRLEDTKLLPHYAHLFLLTPVFKRELRRKIATTSGIYNLRKEHIEKIKISLPPLKIQKQIVERMDKIAEAQRLNDELIQKADELFQSLLHKELDPSGKNWEIKKLENLIENIKIGPFGSALKIAELSESGPVRVLFIENVVNNKFEFAKEKFISEEKYKELEVYTVKTDDILVTMMGTIGRTCITPKEIGKSIISSHLIKISPNKKVTTAEFLNFSLHNPYVTDQIRRKAKGAIMKGLNSKILRNLDIPLPALEIQKQIVEKLSAAQKYKKQLLARKSKLKELFDSVLHKSMILRR